MQGGVAPDDGIETTEKIEVDRRNPNFASDGTIDCFKDGVDINVKLLFRRSNAVIGFQFPFSLLCLSCLRQSPR